MSKPTKSPGIIRVGRRIYKGASYVDPEYPGFTSVVCMTASTEYGSLSPYALKDVHGRIHENLWQGSKIYPKTYKLKQKKSRYSDEVIFETENEEHCSFERDDENIIIPESVKIASEYWDYKYRLENNDIAVRYPVGRQHMSKCLFSLKEISYRVETGDKESDKKKSSKKPSQKIIRKYEYPVYYVDARKEIYLPLYLKLIEDSISGSTKQLAELRKRWKSGENLLIIEVDGPHQESLDYYKKEYPDSGLVIEKDTVVCSPTPEDKKQGYRNLDILLNDPKHPFGHGYCLAIAIQKIGDKYADYDTPKRKGRKRIKIESTE